MREDWKIRTLEDICEKIFAGGDKPEEKFSPFKTEEYNIPIFANGEKNKGLYGFTSIAKVDKPSITVSARGTIGYSEIRNKPFFPIVRLIVLTPNSEIVNLKYLQYVVSSMDFKKGGTSIPQLTVPMIKKYESVIPSIEEQKKIVALLDSAFATIDQAKANIEKNIENAKELFQSKLNEIFSQKGDGWEEKTLKEITTKIGSGATPRGGQSSYKESGISLIRSMNVHDNGFREKKLAFIDEEQASKLNNVTIQKNDILFNITGASVARCCIVDNSFLPARVNQHVSIIRLKEGLMSSKFLHFALTSIETKKILLGIGEQGATRQAITKAQIENFIIAFPSKIEAQDQLIKSLETLEAQTEEIKFKYEHKLNSLEELKKSILQKAFAGELTQKDVSA